MHNPAAILRSPRFTHQDVGKCAALVVAHPGHEVRVSGWYESARPWLFVLTDGSRAGGKERLSSARSFAGPAGARQGSLFGSYCDRDIYAAILARDATLFIRWTAALADAFVALAPALVVIDGWQMYNVSHDLTHVMARVAAERAAGRLRRTIDVVEFEVVPRVLAQDRSWGAEAFRVTLDDAGVARKHAAAEAYRDLREEFHQVLALESRERQGIEVFHRVVDFSALMPAPGTVPPYEKYGEQRVAAGLYRDVIRWHDHVRGIVEAIRMIEAPPMALACGS